MSIPTSNKYKIPYDEVMWRALDYKEDWFLHSLCWNSWGNWIDLVRDYKSKYDPENLYCNTDDYLLKCTTCGRSGTSEQFRELKKTTIFSSRIHKIVCPCCQRGWLEKKEEEDVCIESKD